MASPPAFIDRLCPAPLGGGFSLPDHWIWCGSAIRGPEGRYHLFASSWPKSLAFHPHWVTNSRTVRAVADRPEGPYAFVEDVLPPRGPGYWDGRATHNATIHYRDGSYYLFYTGITYPEDPPFAGAPIDAASPLAARARAAQRIGLATAPSPEGPWQRADRPLIEPRANQWDALMTTNPAACIREDGRTLLAYKSARHHKAKLEYGMAVADQPEGPYRRLAEAPIFQFPGNEHIEDAYLWHNGQFYEIVMKDMAGGLSGEPHAGIHATSPDGLKWTLSEPALAYSRKLLWEDGSRTEQGNLERPQLLIEDGRPTHIFFATTEGGKHFRKGATHSYNLCVPLRD